jgi:hypothetical protein
MTKIFKTWFDGQVVGDDFNNGQLNRDIGWVILQSVKDNDTAFTFYSTMFINLIKRKFESLTLEQNLWLEDNLPTEFNKFKNKWL